MNRIDFVIPVPVKLEMTLRMVFDGRPFVVLQLPKEGRVISLSSEDGCFHVEVVFGEEEESLLYRDLESFRKVIVGPMLENLDGVWFKDRFDRKLEAERYFANPEKFVEDFLNG